MKAETVYGDGKSSIIVYDAALIDHAPVSLFDPEHWRSCADVSEPSGGRGQAWMIKQVLPDQSDREWVLRHYRRGGLVAKWVEDQYFWLGWARSRPVREWQITAWLYAQGLPVPHPVAAAGWRKGFTYRADLITARVPGRPVSSWVETGGLDAQLMSQIGRVVRQLHDVGLYHSDLNTHNILATEDGQVSVIDFDQAAVRQPGQWMQNNLQRLRRSFVKVAATADTANWNLALWNTLHKAYEG